MVRLGKEDNFWEHGSGPCGPCSEIYFDRGAEKGCGSPDCHVGCDCDRFVEVWNLVFSQFDSDGNGHYAEMKNKNIDTGMGLERLACVMQEVDNLFEVDTVQNIMKHICRIADVNYGQNDKTDVSLRVITDHVRSTTFMIGDGITPENTGRGYVLRRLLRRAARHGRLLGIERPFLYEVCDTVINENKSAYPELDEKRELIKRIIKNEEETFAKTIDKGMELLTTILDRLSEKHIKTLSGEDTFKLSDTYGFPIDLTVEIAQEKGLEVDEEKFRELVQGQKDKAREDYLKKGGSSWADNNIKVNAPATVFDGYKVLDENTEIVAIFKGKEQVETLAEGEEGVIILSKTPFYAESGGQTGDCGEISNGINVFEVMDTKKTEDGHFMHIGRVETGSFNVKDSVEARVDKETRMATMRNHTSAHLLQAALREVLGDHVHQKGQLVNSERCRFDFSHFSAMTPEEILKVEEIVNENILSALEVTTKELPISEAKKLGAMALFGEKYGDIVRVVDIEGKSIEFCGGTHVANTSNIGLFKIISEASVASGVRRIEALTGAAALKYYQHQDELLKTVCSAVKATPENLVKRVEGVIAEQRQTAKELESLKAKMAGSAAEGILSSAVDVKGIKLVCAEIKDSDANALRTMGDQLKNKLGSGVVVLASAKDGKVSLLAMATDDAVKAGAHAGNIIKAAAAVCGGGGGGRPNMAQAGGKDATKIAEALETAKTVLEGQL